MENKIKFFTIWRLNVALRLMFTDKVRRVDIRCLSMVPRCGVSLTPSELKFCADYAEFYNDESTEALFYDLKIERDGSKTFKISKGSKPGIILSKGFFKIWKPWFPAMIYLISNKDLPIKQLLDLKYLSSKMSLQELKKRNWVEFKDDEYVPKMCFLHDLGVIDLDLDKKSKIDWESIVSFCKDDSILFDSLCQFMYI